jgi:hypothetical protein
VAHFGFSATYPSGKIPSHKEVAMPDTITLSEAAIALLRHRISTKDDAVTPDNLEAYRELARAGVMIPLSTFTKGPESLFKFTDEGWERRHEFLVPRP